MTSKNLSRDSRIERYTEAARRMQTGSYDVSLPASTLDAVGRLGGELQQLAGVLEERRRELQHLESLTRQVNAGLLLDEILERVYSDFRGVIPYNRIGFSLMENDGRLVRARWARSDQPEMKIGRGFSAPLAGSSLESILATGQPRILNDLLAYLAHKPQSDSTRLIVAEGMRASLTCPLIANGVPIGFMFFSSIRPDTYSQVHVETFQWIAGQLSVIVEKGRLVSEMAEQKASIERQNEELRRLSEVKNTFLGIAAHDLRNPLSSIQLIAELLESGAAVPEAERAAFLGDIVRQTEYMLALLNDLLDVSQLDAGRLSLRRQPIETRSWLEETVVRQAALARNKDTRVLLEAAPSGILHGDPQRLRQVLDNLISNAVKYSPPGSTVRVRCEHGPAGWRVGVQDQGPGLTPQDRQHLFQDFARLSARPTGGEKSVGLGLAISRRVVEAHGGTIGAESEAGQGATFWFLIPEEAQHE